MPIFFALAGSAFANNECGPDTAGPSIVNCAPGNYSFIRYTNSDGLTVNLDDPGINVHNTSINGAIRGGVAIHNSLTGNDLVINGNNFGTVETEGSAGYGFFIFNNGSGDAIGRLTNGTILTHGANNAHGIYAGAAGSGNAIAEMNGGTISTEGVTSFGIYASGSAAASGNASATLNGGSITTAGIAAHAVYAYLQNTNSTATASAQMTGGDIETTGGSAWGLAASTSGLGVATATMTGGTITTSGASAYGIRAASGNAASAATVTATMSGGSITTTGGASHGIMALTAGTGLADLGVDGTSVVSVSGNNADAVQAASAGGNYAVDVQGGTLTGGAGFGAGIHTIAAAGGTVAIGNGATVNAGASGIAIRDGDNDYDGVDEIGGNASVTTAGTVTGDAVLGLGNDSFNLTGGSYTGHIYGDDVTAGAGDGNDGFTWSAGTLSGGIHGQNGSDTLLISAGGYDGTQVLDGGDDALSADGWVDVLTLSGAVGVVVADASTTLLNWETLVLNNSTATINQLETENIQLNGSTLTLNDATVTQAISGGAGNEQLTLGGSTGVAGDLSLGDGSDSLTLDGPGVVIGGAIDGGDDNSSADGFIDTLTFANNPGTWVIDNAFAAALVNWEIFGFTDQTTVISGSVEVETINSCGGSTSIGGASNITEGVNGCASDDTLTITDDATVARIEGAGGADSITVNGNATVTGAILGGGDGADASAAADTGDTIVLDTTGSVGSVDTGLGDDSAAWRAGAVASGIAMGDGSDSLVVTAADYDGTQSLDGGDDTSSADGWTDVVTFSGLNFSAPNAATTLTNWETVSLVDSNADVTGLATENVTLENSTLTLGDATVTEGIRGSAGDESLILAGTTAIGTDVVLGDGSDSLTLDGPGVGIAGSIDGGDDASSGDGFIDTLSFTNGVTGTFSVDNWEIAAVTSGSDVTLSDGTVVDVKVANAAATLADLSVTGQVTGSFGDEWVTLTGATAIGGDVSLGWGSDTLTLSGSQLSLNSLNGGDGVGTGDGFIDRLILDGFAGALDNPQNWEQIRVQGGSDLELVSDTTFGELQILEGSVDLGNGPLSLYGDVTIGPQGVLNATGGGNGLYTLSGQQAQGGPGRPAWQWWLINWLLDPQPQRHYGVINNGIITTQDGAAGDTLHIVSDYSSDGGVLLMDAVLAGDDSPADKAVFDAAIGGTTLLNVNNVGGAGALTDAGIVVIETAYELGDFVLDGDYITDEGEPVVVGGAYAYRLVPASDGTWRLSSFFDDVPGGVVYQPLVPAYEVLARGLLALDELPTLQQRVGNRSWGVPGNAAQIEADGTSAWVRVAGSTRDMISETSSTGAAYDMRTTELQVGVDTLVEANVPGRVVVGVNGGYADGYVDVDSIYGASDIRSKGFSLGLTGTWYGEDGGYVDGQFKYTWSDSDVSAPGAATTEGIDGTGYGVSVEAGKRFALDAGQGLSLTPQAQLRYARVDISDTVGAYGERVSIEDGESLVGRVGLSLDRESEWGETEGKTNRTHTYVLANVLHEFDDRTRNTVAGVEFENRIDDWALELGVGGSYSLDGGKYVVYGEIARASSLDNFSENTELKADIGVRVRF